jgi:DNA-binding transcriptional LysR family regulator
MELRNLRAFAAVVRTGGFSAAAREIGSTQSSVSKALLQLEHECGETLLERLPRGVVPTDAGRIVLDHAHAIIARHEELDADLKALRGLESGSLRLGMPLIGSGPLFAAILAQYFRLYPSIKVELQESGGQLLEAAVQQGEIEIAASLLPAPSGFASYQVCDEPVMAVLASQHPLANRDRVRLKELSSTPCILFTHGFALNAIISAAYARRSLPLVPAARSTQPDFMLALAAAGLGVAYLPRLMITPRPDIRIVPVDEPKFRWRLGLVWRNNLRLSPAAQRFLELTKEMLPGKASRTAN